jgi:O-methyltransferase involved in polyketide biosynthesis
MFGFSREQWTSWIMGGVVSYLVARALQLLWTTLGGLDWAPSVSALANPNVQA